MMQSLTLSGREFVCLAKRNGNMPPVAGKNKWSSPGAMNCYQRTDGTNAMFGKANSPRKTLRKMDSIQLLRPIYFLPMDSAWETWSGMFGNGAMTRGASITWAGDQEIQSRSFRKSSRWPKGVLSFATTATATAIDALPASQISPMTLPVTGAFVALKTTSCIVSCTWSLIAMSIDIRRRSRMTRLHSLKAGEKNIGCSWLRPKGKPPSKVG